HAGPPKVERQFVGGDSPPGPLPSRKTYSSRSGAPGPAFNAAWNQGCSSEVWLGTMSIMTLSRRLWAARTIASKSDRVPRDGSTSRKSDTSYPPSVQGEG